MRILAVGGATLDIINSVSDYPKEDDELRATAQHQRRGGNASNTLVVLSQLGHHCSWAGTLGDDEASRYIMRDLHHNGVDATWARLQLEGITPTSYIITSQATGSRTIVHYRDLPEYQLDAFEKIDLNHYDWIHFEGREVSAYEPMLRHARHSLHSATISLEIEKPRSGIESLVPLVDVVFLAKAYAASRGYKCAQDLFDSIRPYSDCAILFATWGEDGAWLQTADEEVRHESAYRPPQVIDTLGAGDVFNAGVIDGLLAGSEPAVALRNGVRLAGEKCGRWGIV
ncbi:MAG: PfkB family carbohydrate kinase [Candidatus Thiodiazotropha sp.]|jgi:ketohexokinase